MVLFFGINNPTIFDFNSKSELSDWMIVNDVVMGGRSDADMYIGEDGNAIFSGTVSLENYGGFASVRHRFPTRIVEEFNKIKIRLKGDGKRYQFRVKNSKYDRHSYISYFQTSGEWQTIEIPLKDMSPQFRGRRLNMPNYPCERMEEIAFLIGNKKAESFRLEIDSIGLE